MKAPQSVKEELQELTPGATTGNAASEHSRYNAVSVAIQDVHTYGFSQRSGYEKTIASFMTAYVQRAWNTVRRVSEARIDTLKDVDGIVEPGEMLLVLGRPGSGCSTLLKTLAGPTHDFNIGPM